VVLVNVQPVRSPEDTFTPRAQKIALSVEYDHRMLAAVEDVDLVLTVHSNRGNVFKLPCVGKFGPIVHHRIAMFTTAQHDRHGTYSLLRQPALLPLCASKLMPGSLDCIDIALDRCLQDALVAYAYARRSERRWRQRHAASAPRQSRLSFRQCK